MPTNLAKKSADALGSFFCAIIIITLLAKVNLLDVSMETNKFGEMII